MNSNEKSAHYALNMSRMSRTVVFNKVEESVGFFGFIGFAEDGAGDLKGL